MYISKIVIKNFRIFDENGITVYFKKGVNAIISENNCGKTAIIDAIRIALSTVPYKKDIFFNLSDFHVCKNGKRSDEAFISIFFNEISPDFFEIWNPEDETKGEFHIKYYTIKNTDGKEKVRFNAWGGPVEGNSVSADIFDSIQTVFLGALRDAETEMRPSRSSKLASLFETATNTDYAKEEIVDILRKANGDILKNPSLLKVGEIVNENLSTIEQDVLRQHIELGLVEPKFESIAASIRAWIKPRWFYLDKATQNYHTLKNSYTNEEWSTNTIEDENGTYIDVCALKALNKQLVPEASELLNDSSNGSFELFQNGLGYNNLLFMSAVLGDMNNSSSALFSLLLVEEPEAHLHPQLQELVFSFFEKNSEKYGFQVIFTSHSPTLVSRVGIERIILLYERNYRTNCLSLSQSKIDANDLDNLERYLDVTKSQMLFAKGIIFVEGISEALLIPIFAEYLNRQIDRYAVSIVNVDGVSFKPFANLISYANIQPNTINATIITDDDRCTDKKSSNEYIDKNIDYDTNDIDSIIEKLNNGTPSERYLEIDKLCTESNIQICGARKTFEYELATYPENIPYLLKAIEQACPQVGKSLSTFLATLQNNNEKAARIWLFIRYRPKIKGEIAQNLARILKEELNSKDSAKTNISNESKKFIVPKYIKDAIFSVTIKE